MMIDKLETPFGKILISVIFGIGIASFFRMTCKDGRCVVISGPNPSDIQANMYKIEDKCYKYVPYAAKCEK